MAYTVLIIDGDAKQRKALSHSLQNRLGCRTYTATSAESSVDHFSGDFPPDMVLIDWNTGGGRAAIVDLKQLSDAPIVALIKFADFDAGIAALNAGALDFLTKPVAIERLSTTFRNLLMLRDALREVERLRGQQRLPASDNTLFPMPPPLELLSRDGNIRRMGEIEAEAIRFAMQYYHGRMTEVAKRLGIGRSTLYRKLSGLDEPVE